MIAQVSSSSAAAESRVGPTFPAVSLPLFQMA